MHRSTRVYSNPWISTFVLSRRIAVSPIGREGNSTWSCGNGTFKCICIGNTETEIAVNHSRSPFLSPFCLIKISVALRVTMRKMSTMMFSVHAEVAVTTIMLERDSFYWRLSLLRYIDSRFFADSSYTPKSTYSRLAKQTRTKNCWKC